MKITIASDVITETGTSEAGKAFTSRHQLAYLHEAGKPFPTSCKLPLYDNARAYPQGDYNCSQELEINQWNKLRVKSDIVLLPAVAAVAAAK